MKINEYLKQSNQTINGFAGKNGLPVATVWRAVQGRIVCPENAKRISQATGGQVSKIALLYPDEDA